MLQVLQCRVQQWWREGSECRAAAASPRPRHGSSYFSYFCSTPCTLHSQPKLRETGIKLVSEWSGGHIIIGIKSNWCTTPGLFAPRPFVIQRLICCHLPTYKPRVDMTARACTRNCVKLLLDDQPVRTDLASGKTIAAFTWILLGCEVLH